MTLSHTIKRGLFGILVLPLVWSCATLHEAETKQCPTDLHPAQTTQTTVASQDAVPAVPEEISNDDQTPSEAEATLDQEIKGLEALGPWEAGTLPDNLPGGATGYDFPVSMNRQVQFYLDFFAKDHRQLFSRWLVRSGRYLPMIREELSSAGLPQDLCYLPMIESGFNLTAFSTAAAVGPWQFMKGTGNRFGLSINTYEDERRDPEKATRAGIAYLKILHDRFDSWYLAVAAYNAGEGTIDRAVDKCGTNDFWQLAKKECLPLETRRYVPQLIAAILIAKNPEVYGFNDIAYEKPLAYGTCEVPRGTSLKAVAVACDTPFEEVWNLNRHLCKAMTPPGASRYAVKVPVGTEKLMARNLPRVKATTVTEYKTHVVQDGETVGRVCKIYNINKTTLLKANNLRSARLTPSQRLRIPSQSTVFALQDESAAPTRTASLANVSATKQVVHKIKPGETLAAIAKQYHVSMPRLAAWNNLSKRSAIRAGQQLTIHLSDNNAPAAMVVATALPASDRSAKNIVLASTGKKSRPTSAGKTTAARDTYYEVQGGDTLWKIARKFNTTTNEIRRWNKLEDNTIHPGVRLLLKITADADV